MPVAAEHRGGMPMQKSVSMELHSIEGTRYNQRKLPRVPNFEVSKLGLGAFIGQKKPRRVPAILDDPFRFSPPGMDFKAKFIGVQDVSEARGERMCQDAMRVLKAVVKSTGRHKQRIIVNVSVEGVKLLDDRAAHVLYSFPVHKISFVARDITDSRAFGFVVGMPGTQHRFYGIKTEKTSDIVVFNIRDMFQVVFEMKKRQQESRREEHPPTPPPQAAKVVETAWISFPAEQQDKAAFAPSSSSMPTTQSSPPQTTKASDELLLLDYNTPVSAPPAVVDSRHVLQTQTPLYMGVSSNESSGIFSESSYSTSSDLLSGDSSWCDTSRTETYRKNEVPSYNTQLQSTNVAFGSDDFFHSSPPVHVVPSQQHEFMPAFQNGNFAQQTNVEQMVPPDPFDTSHVSQILMHSSCHAMPSNNSSSTLRQLSHLDNTFPTSGSATGVVSCVPHADSSQAAFSAATQQQSLVPLQQHDWPLMSHQNSVGNVGAVVGNVGTFSSVPFSTDPRLPAGGPPLPPRPRPSTDASASSPLLPLPKPPLASVGFSDTKPVATNVCDPFSDDPFFQ